MEWTFILCVPLECVRGKDFKFVISLLSITVITPFTITNMFDFYYWNLDRCEHDHICQLMRETKTYTVVSVKDQWNARRLSCLVVLMFSVTVSSKLFNKDTSQMVQSNKGLGFIFQMSSYVYSVADKSQRQYIGLEVFINRLYFVILLVYPLEI